MAVFRPFLQWCDDERIERVVKILRPYVYGRTLDVGCWNGEVTHRLGIDAVGIDVALPPKVAIPATIFDGTHIPFAESEFDTVLCCTALHHAHDQDALLEEMIRVGKRLVILEDEYDSWLSRSSVLALHAIGSRIVKIPYHAGGFRSLEGWQNLFASHALAIRQYVRYPGIQPLWFGLRHHLFVLDSLAKDSENSQPCHLAMR
jgi:SAM-dependent methyltransferase